MCTSEYSNVLPSETDLSVNLTKNITLKVPFLSSAMDAVPGPNAIAMAKAGGIGIIHRNLSVENEAKINKVKKKLVVGAAVEQVKKI